MHAEMTCPCGATMKLDDISTTVVTVQIERWYAVHKDCTLPRDELPHHPDHHDEHEP